MSSEVAIIGAGPIGLEVAVALKRAGIEYLHFDASQVGQSIFRFPPQTRFFSSNDRIAIAGVPLQTVDQAKATREDYLRYLRTVAELFDLKLNTYEPVAGIERAGGEFVLTTEPPRGRQSYRVRRLVLATGGTSRPRRLGVPGEELPHVSHCCSDPHVYFRKRVLIVGGRNSAIEAALRCHAAGADVTISYRGAAFDPAQVKYWLLPEISGRVESGAIKACFNTVPTEITPTHVGLRSLAIGAHGEPSRVEADFVLVLIGFIADMSLCGLAGVEVAGPNEAPRYDERTMETNVPGVYVAGTIIGGTQQQYRVFIENCHIHAARIVAAITGAPAPMEGSGYRRPET